MPKLTHEFKKIKIELLHGRVIKCVIDGVEGKLISSYNRHIFCFGKKFVIKFDSSTNPKSKFGGHNTKFQNKTEIKNYNLVYEEDRKYFAAILRTGKVCGRVYVVQEFVETTRRAFLREVDEYRVIRQKYNIMDSNIDATSKQGHHNVAVNSKGFKFYDLGFEHKFTEYNAQRTLF